MQTRSPRIFSRRPRLEAVSPLPRLEATPPVTKTCLVSTGLVWIDVTKSGSPWLLPAVRPASPRGIRISSPDLSRIGKRAAAKYLGGRIECADERNTGGDCGRRDRRAGHDEPRSRVRHQPSAARRGRSARGRYRRRGGTERPRRAAGLPRDYRWAGYRPGRPARAAEHG